MAPTKKPAGVASRLGARVRELREARGLTQEQLAWECEFTKGYVSLIEAGKRVPTVFALAILGKRLEVEIADFFAWDTTVPRIALLDAARTGDAVAARRAWKKLNLGEAASSFRSREPAKLRVAETTEPRRPPRRR